MFEGLKLPLAYRSTYTPDFLVIKNLESGCIALEAHEVKGFWRPDAWEKIKTAATLFYWIKFIAVKYKGGAWEFEIIPPIWGKK